MKFQLQFAAACLFLGMLNPVFSQEKPTSEKPSRRRIQLHMEYHFQRAKLLKSRLELLKKSQESEELQVKSEVKALSLKRQMIENEIHRAEAELELKKNNAARLEKLYERNVVPESEVQNAKHQLARAEAEIRNLHVEAEQLKQETTGAELTLKRRQLDGAIRRNEVELELLEAEFRVKELKLELEAD